MASPFPSSASRLNLLAAVASEMSCVHTCIDEDTSDRDMDDKTSTAATVATAPHATTRRKRRFADRHSGVAGNTNGTRRTHIDLKCFELPHAAILGRNLQRVRRFVSQAHPKYRDALVLTDRDDVPRGLYYSADTKRIYVAIDKHRFLEYKLVCSHKNCDVLVPVNNRFMCLPVSWIPPVAPLLPPVPRPPSRQPGSVTTQTTS